MQFGTNFVFGQSRGEMPSPPPYKRPFRDGVILSRVASRAWLPPTDPFILEDFCVPAVCSREFFPSQWEARLTYPHVDTRPCVSLCISIILWEGTLDPEPAAGKG